MNIHKNPRLTPRAGTSDKEPTLRRTRLAESRKTAVLDHHPLRKSLMLS